MSTAKSATRFDLISDECVGLIASLLTFEDLKSITLIGSSALNAKIHRSVEEIRVSVPSLGKWPLQAFRYPKLRSLTIKSESADFEIAIYSPMIVENGLLIPAEGHQHLQSLEIHSPFSFALLSEDSDCLPLQKYLPSLVSLNLVGDGYFDSEKLVNLPPTLTDLFLKPRQTLRHIYTGALISALPRTLTSLVLAGNIQLEDNIGLQPSFSLGPHRSKKAVDPVFPPHLTKLHYKAEYPGPTLALIPLSVTDLKVKSGYIQDILHFKVSHLLPPRLASFELNVPLATRHLAIVLDRPFPASLTKLKLPHGVLQLVDSNNVPADLNLYLPPSITSFTGLDNLHEQINWSKTLPALKDAFIDKSAFQTETPISSFPPLTTLRIPKGIINAETLRALPSTLTTLLAAVQNEPVWLETMARLTRLEILDLHHSSGVLPSHGFWDLMRTRLQRLGTSFGPLESIEALNGEWTRLKILDLSDSHLETMKPELAQYQSDFYAQPKTGDEEPTASSHSPRKRIRLSSTLETVHLNLRTEFAILRDSLQDLKQLKRCSLAFLDWPKQEAVEMCHPYSILSHLPSSVTYLQCHFQQMPKPEHMASLPNGLKTLNFTVHRVEAIWTDNHLRCLPPNLVDGSLEYGSMNITDKDVLPPTMMKFRIANHASDLLGFETRAMEEAAEQREWGE